jgi:hypothetical protein
MPPAGDKKKAAGKKEAKGADLDAQGDAEADIARLELVGEGAGWPAYEAAWQKIEALAEDALRCAEPRSYAPRR